jgi:hypothetical protein
MINKIIKKKKKKKTVKTGITGKHHFHMLYTIPVHVTGHEIIPCPTLHVHHVTVLIISKS